MTDERRPMPEVTVRDPNGPDRSADVLVSGGEDRLPLDPAVKRRRLRVAGALLLVGALVLAGLEVRERRTAAAEERRLGGVVDLRVEQEGVSSSFDPVSRTARLTMQLLLHNDGPRDVQALAASVAGYELLSGDVRLGAGRSGRMLLEKSLTCDPASPPPTTSGDLRVTVRTPTLERQVEIPLPTDADEAARLCGFRPLEAMLVSFGDLARPAPDVVDLSLELETRAVGPVHLVALVAGPGIAVQPRVEGRARGLPLELTPGDDWTRTLSVSLRLTVSDCAAARGTSGDDLPDPTAQGGMLLQLRDDTGAVNDALVGYPERLLDSLVSESCG